MPGLQILTKSNPILKQICKPITFPLTQQTKENIQNLKQTFRQSFISKGVRTLGLAAPQIGVSQRFFIMPKNFNISTVNARLLQSIVRNFNVFINPKILSASQSRVKLYENCLSVGMQVYSVDRAQSITVEYFNMDGKRIQEDLTGIKARVFLHQNDHLNGILMDSKGQFVAQNLRTLQKQLEQKEKKRIQGSSKKNIVKEES